MAETNQVAQDHIPTWMKVAEDAFNIELEAFQEALAAAKKDVNFDDQSMEEQQFGEVAVGLREAFKTSMIDVTTQLKKATVALKEASTMKMLTADQRNTCAQFVGTLTFESAFQETATLKNSYRWERVGSWKDGQWTGEGLEPPCKITIRKKSAGFYEENRYWKDKHTCYTWRPDDIRHDATTCVTRGDKLTIYHYHPLPSVHHDDILIYKLPLAGKVSVVISGSRRKTFCTYEFEPEN